MTGGRLKRVMAYLNGETFCFTYVDGVSDVNISDLVGYHRNQGTLATMTAIQPPGRYGSLDIAGNLVRSFQEKPKGDGGWINGGFFVLEPQVVDYIANSSVSGKCGYAANVSEADKQLYGRCSMQAIRQIVKRESIKAVVVPEKFGENVEIIVLPIKETKGSKYDSEQLMKLQEQSGFIRTAFANSQEDVWNEL